MRHTRIYMAVTADELELPCCVGSAQEIARFAGLTMGSFYSAVSRKQVTRSGYKIYMIEVV